MKVKLEGTFLLSQAVYLRMKEQRYGKIINISCMAGERGGRYAGANYSASKGGVILITKCFALCGGENGLIQMPSVPALYKLIWSREFLLLKIHQIYRSRGLENPKR